MQWITNIQSLMLPIYGSSSVDSVLITFQILRLIFFATILSTKADKTVASFNVFWGFAKKFTADISETVIDCDTFSPTLSETFAEPVPASKAKVS